MYQRKDDPNRNQSVIFAWRRGYWKQVADFIANGKPMYIWLWSGEKIKISSCGKDEYFVVTIAGLKKVRMK